LEEKKSQKIEIYELIEQIIKEITEAPKFDIKKSIILKLDKIKEKLKI
jgi:hypothetical protein